jgi:hypothetical protein
MVQAVSFTPYVANRETHLGIQTPAGADLLFGSSGKTQENFSRSTQKAASNPAFDGDNIFEMEIDVPLFNEQPQIMEPVDGPGLSFTANPVVDPKDKLLVYIPPNESIPSFGMTPITFAKTSVPQAKPSKGFSESQTEWMFRDLSLCLKISKASGNITHFSLSPTTTNLLGPTGIGYTLHTISPSRPKSPLQVDTIEVIEKGPLRFTFLIKYQPTKSKTLISTRICIYHQSRQIYGETLVDLKDTNMLLALEVDTQLSPKAVYCGGPYCVHRHVVPATSKFLNQIDEVPFQEFVYWTSDRKTDSIGTVAVYFQTKFGMSISGNVPRFHLVAAKPLPQPDTTMTFPDSDMKSRVNVSDQGYQRIPWAIEFLPPSVPVSTIMRHASEYNAPFVLAPTHAVHDTLSFFSVDSPNVMLVSVKEIEEFMREAPDWFYKPTMAELTFVIQCLECNGIETTCSLQIDPSISLKQAMEVDFIERISHNGIQTSDVMLSGHTVKFTIRPHEIKSIMVVGRIILEQV